MIALFTVAVAAERYALVAGAADGGPGRAPLHHTTADANRIADVLVGVGGVAPDHLRLLVDPSLAEVRESLSGLRASLAADPGAVEAVVYFTGHSDATGLRFGPEHLGYDELRAAVDQLPADVRLVIIDGCSSGAVLREKGGTREPPVALSSEVDGVAYLTSSAADEVSQESDELGGSFFTHSLATGLRGAADGSGDGQVTLAEAYRYAYDRTLALTWRTLGGAQHPSFDLRLAGAGDLVLTRLDGAEGQLVVPAGLGDAVTVRRVDGAVVAELGHGRAADTVLALPPGRYELVVADSGARSGATVSVREHQPLRVESAALRPLPEASTRDKGRSTKTPVRAALLGLAAIGVTGAAVSFDAYLRAPPGQPGPTPLQPLYGFGALAVLSTTTLVVTEGAR